MLDLGICRKNTASHLHQYAILGSFYAKNVRGIANPRVGLIIMGLRNKGIVFVGLLSYLRSQVLTLLTILVRRAKSCLEAADVVVADGFHRKCSSQGNRGTGLGYE